MSIRPVSKILAAAALLPIGAALPLPLSAQVTIPAQSATSRDDAETPQSVPPSLPAASLQRNSPVASPPPPGPAASTGPAAPAAERRPGDPVAAMQRVPEPVQNIDLVLIDRLAELRRDLRIADAANLAKIALRSDDFFLRSNPEEIDDYALPTLQKVLEFIELNPKQTVTLRSFHAPGSEEDKALAAKRSEVLLEWFRENASIEPEQFRADPPQALERPNPRKSAAARGDADFAARIEFLLSRQ